MTRMPVILSGAIFVFICLSSYRFFGWKDDGWALVIWAILHLGVVLRFYPILDAFSVILHYTVTAGSLTGIIWIIVDIGGKPAGSWNILWALLKDKWTQPVAYGFLVVYTAVIGLSILLITNLLPWLASRPKLHKHELLAGFFVASLLTIPCDFALVDTLSEIAVLNPEDSGPFVFASGIQSLDQPIVFHIFVTLFIVAATWGRLTQVPGPPAGSPGHNEVHLR